jgi:hypothetical protein
MSVVREGGCWSEVLQFIAREQSRKHIWTKKVRQDLKQAEVKQWCFNEQGSIKPQD